MERLDYHLGTENLPWSKKVVNKLKEIVSFRWGKAVLILIAVIPLLIGIINVPSWPNWTGLNSKTTWDLLDLAIIPIILAIVAAWVRRIESERAVKREELDKVDLARGKVHIWEEIVPHLRARKRCKYKP